MSTEQIPGGAWLALRYEDPGGLLDTELRDDILAAHERLLSEVAGTEPGAGGGIDGPIQVRFDSAADATAAAVSIQLRLGDPLRQLMIMRPDAGAGVGAVESDGSAPEAAAAGNFDPERAARLQVAAALAGTAAEAARLCRIATGGQVLCALDAWAELRRPSQQSTGDQLMAMLLRSRRPEPTFGAADVQNWQEHRSGAMECLYDNAQALLNAPFERMFAAELRGWVRPRRARRDREGGPTRPLPFPERPDARNDLYGVALSGGGMRSGVFSLGVVQALARSGMLADVDYLSTVSGGGYAGVSLASLCAEPLPYAESPARLGMEPDDFPYAFPRVTVRPEHDEARASATGEAMRLFPLPVHANESPALHHVRGHANLLGYGIGLFDGYTWRAVGRYLASTVILWLLFLIPVATLLGLAGILALEGVDVTRLLLMATLPVSLFVAVAILSATVYYDRTDPLTAYFNRLLPALAGISGVMLVALTVAIGAWWAHQIWEAIGGGSFTAITATVAAFSAGTTGIALRKVGSLTITRRLLWMTLVGLGGYLLLWIGMVSWIYMLWRRMDAGILGVPMWGVAIIALGVIAVTLVGDQGRRLLNHFSLHDLYAERIGQTWVIGAVPRRERGRQRHPGAAEEPSDAEVVAMQAEQAVGARKVAARWTRVWTREDLRIADLAPKPGDGAPTAPYPLIGAALNLPGSRGPKLLDRKAESFVIAPIYSGSALSRWLPTEQIRQVHEMSLASAAAVSGAAVSPNMGVHTSRTLSILTTLLNVRLGRWIDNPRTSKRGPLGRWVLDRPLTLYWKEMFGLASREDGQVYLSDGGHFENSGLYELLRRRCKYIVAVMADTETHDYGPLGFGNLGTAIRLARVDFGVEVEMKDLRPISRDPQTGFVPYFFAVGTIRYPGAPGHSRAGDDQSGTIVVIKTGLADGSLSPDIVNYWRVNNPGFPYDSTLDQQMDQLQFESYRQLGFLAGRAVCREMGPPGATLEERFRALEGWPDRPTAIAPVPGVAAPMSAEGNGSLPADPGSVTPASPSGDR